MVDDVRHAGPGLDVVQDRWLVPQATLGGVDVLVSGLADATLDRPHQRARLAADKGSTAAADLDLQVETRAENVLAQQTRFSGLLQGEADMLDRQGVFVADVDIARGSAHSVGADDDAFENAVRVGLQQAAVHERAGIALVGIADDVLGLSVGSVGRLPLASGGKACPASAAQSRALDDVNDRIG